jgi:hypothetical protein
MYYVFVSIQLFPDVMLATLAKFLTILHRRCKGRPHMMGFFEEDPEEFKAVAKLILNDQAAGFVDSNTRLPIRFFVQSMHFLHPMEIGHVRGRVEQFLSKWEVLANPAPSSDPSIRRLTEEHSLTSREIFRFIALPPPQFVPECKSYFF